MAKRKMIIKLDRKPQDIVKETPEQRAERIKYASTMRTQVVPNKKHYDRKKLGKVATD